MTILELLLFHDSLSVVLLFSMLVLSLTDIKRIRMYIIIFSLIDILIQLNDIVKLAVL